LRADYEDGNSAPKDVAHREIDPGKAMMLNVREQLVDRFRVQLAAKDLLSVPAPVVVDAAPHVADNDCPVIEPLFQLFRAGG